MTAHVAEPEVHLLPADAHPSWPRFEDLGFVRLGCGPIVGGFWEVRLPLGWTRRHNDDNPQYSRIFDDRGLDRAGVYIEIPGRHPGEISDENEMWMSDPAKLLTVEALYGHLDGLPIPETAALPEQWDVMTDEERLSYSRRIQFYLDEATRSPDLFTRGDRATELLALLKEKDH